MAYTFKHGDRPLDGFTVQRAIGRGGFGEVYYAISDGGREVAIKYLKENPHVELRGVGHCMNLKSPHLVTIFDVKQNSDEEYFIIMEYISGPSLRDLLIAEPKGFAPEKAAFFAREIAKGLAYLHDRGIVHRDLKPGNIFFDDGYAKIGDYGLSKFISVSRHSAQTASVGTVHYMAPEIGSGNYSRGVDIYALGVMLYEMLLGKVPFEGSSMAEVLMKHLSTQPELDELPEPFGRVIRKALAKDPNDRYQTVEEMVDEMLAGEDIQRSLAGFSAKSLEGAVRLGGEDRHDSPRPSPNPPPYRAPGMAPPPPPYAHAAPGSGMPLPDKIARRLERRKRRIEDRVAKLSGKRPAPRAPADGLPYALPVPPKSDVVKRYVLMLILMVGLSIGFGAVVANSSHIPDLGPAAGMLVAGMIGGIALGRVVSRWFSVDQGPMWAQRIIRGCCAAGPLAIGAAPVLSNGHGTGMFLGLVALAVFGRWERAFEPNDDSEICFGPIFKAALGGLILAAIGEGICDGRPENFMFVAAGVGAISSFVIQAGTSWAAFQRRALRTKPSVPPPAPAPVSPHEAQTIAAGHTPNAPVETPRQKKTELKNAARPAGIARSIIVRGFFSVLAFVFMGGAIVTFLIPVMSTEIPRHEITGIIAGCVGFAALFIFSLRKTTALKRPGFWRDTVRPFLISVALFGVGTSTTVIAREWHSCDAWNQPSRQHVEVTVVDGTGTRSEHVETSHELSSGTESSHRAWADASTSYAECTRPTLGEEGRIAVVSSLVFSSIMLIVLTFFAGGAPRPSKPFLHSQDLALHDSEGPSGRASRTTLFLIIGFIGGAALIGALLSLIID